jgi:hypothetical protein
MQGKGKGLIKSANGYKYEIDFKNDTMMLRQMLIMVVLLNKIITKIKMEYRNINFINKVNIFF